MRSEVLNHVEASIDAYRDLAALLPPDAFERKLDGRSNEIGHQLWCVVGARESYARAIHEGAWAGFDCSLPGSSTGDQAEVIAALDRSSASLKGILESVEWSSSRDRLVLDLLEHEAQHQGQLIRFVYALGYRFPESWKKRWALTD